MIARSACRTEPARAKGNWSILVKLHDVERLWFVKRLDKPTGGSSLENRLDRLPASDNLQVATLCLVSRSRTRVLPSRWNGLCPDRHTDSRRPIGWLPHLMETVSWPSGPRRASKHCTLPNRSLRQNHLPLCTGHWTVPVCTIANSPLLVTIKLRFSMETEWLQKAIEYAENKMQKANHGTKQDRLHLASDNLHVLLGQHVCTVQLRRTGK